MSTQMRDEVVDMKLEVVVLAGSDAEAEWSESYAADLVAKQSGAELPA